MFLRNKITMTLSLALALSALVLAPQAQEAEFSAYVGAGGALSVPEGYRDNLVFIGTWAVHNKEGAGIAGIHNVYTNAEAVAHFREHGEWPDGAVIVKELLEVEAESSIESSLASITRPIRQSITLTATSSAPTTGGSGSISARR